MKIEGTIWQKLLFPHWIIKLLLVIISTVLLIYSLGYKNANPIIAYSSYLISAYTLTIVSLKFPALIKSIKKRLYANKYSKRYLSEPELRATISLYTSSIINIFYALFYLGAGIFYMSLWTISIAVYYIILSLIRFELVRKDRTKLLIFDKTEQRKFELNSCHFCGCFMFLLNIAISVLVALMIKQNKHYDYPGFLIYSQAAYAFYCMTIAIINLLKYRNMKRPILSASSIIFMSCALVSILALQTAMLMQFGSDETNFIRIMNSITGIVVCTSTFVLAIWLVHRTRKELHLLNNQ